jgi:putative resolvase
MIILEPDPLAPASFNAHENLSLSIGKAAVLLGVCISTLRRWHAEARLVPDFCSLGGHRRYKLTSLLPLIEPQQPKAASDAGVTICYARVSGHGQKADLLRQAARLQQHCEQTGYSNLLPIKDLGSGLNFRKPGLKKVLRLILTGEVSRLVLTYKDRLLRFGSELVFELCRARGITVEILDEVAAKTLEQGLCADVIELMTVFSARLHGSRSRKKAA